MRGLAGSARSSGPSTWSVMVIGSELNFMPSWLSPLLVVGQETQATLPPTIGGLGGGVGAGGDAELDVPTPRAVSGIVRTASLAREVSTVSSDAPPIRGLPGPA